MPRIPDDELTRIKYGVPLKDLLEARGFVLTPQGQDLVTRCPFHEGDDTPSLKITPAKNLWHCFGCNEGGDVIKWVQRIEGVSFRHAIEILRRDYPSIAAAAAGQAPVKDSTVPKLPCPLPLDGDDQSLFDKVAELYHENLMRDEAPKEYLRGRGIWNEELVRTFKLGYANRTLGYLVPSRNRVMGAELRGRLQKLGILRESGHEHLAGSLVVPIFDGEGRVVQMYGRKITPRLREGTPLHLYLPRPLKGVWNAPALAGQEEVIVCEALIDAMTFWCAGFKNVLASFGAKGFNDEHLAALQSHGIGRVLIAYDRDEAGDEGAAQLASRLLKEGFGCYRVLFPHGMDANEYARKVTPASKSLAILIRSAVWLGQGEEPPRPEPPQDAPPELAPPPAPDPAAKPAARERAIPPLAASPPASPVPAAPKVTVVVDGDEVAIEIGDRRYRARGLAKNTSHEVLRINLRCARGAGLHVDTLDLYVARQREAFISLAAKELGLHGREEVIKHDIALVLGKLEEIQDEKLKKTLEPKVKVVVLSDVEQAGAMGLLRDPRLLERVVEDLEVCGLVGEEVNKLTGYLAVISRKLEEPLAVMVQSNTAAGKTTLMDGVLAFVPEEDRVKYSAMTGQSLFYMGEKDLKHKVLAIVEQEGASRAGYALKLLQSEGELTIASTGKDPSTGKLVTNEYQVKGPVMVFLTSTAIEIDEELLNRCVILTVDEDREQTRAIHRLQRQRQTLEGLLARRRRERIVKLHQDAQRLLRPLAVVNPFANDLTFLDTKTRTRRDHMKYLGLIQAITLLHQHQRPIRTALDDEGQPVEYVETVIEDIEMANRLAHVVLGRTLDELPPQTRGLLMRLDAMVAEMCAAQQMTRRDLWFTRRQLREHTGWGDTQLKLHLHRLEEMEYVLVHRAERGQGFVYELLYDGQGKDGTPFLPGLIDVEELRRQGYDAERSGGNGHRSGQEATRSGSGRPLVGLLSGAGRGASTGREPSNGTGSSGSNGAKPQNAHLEPEELESYEGVDRTDGKDEDDEPPAPPVPAR